MTCNDVSVNIKPYQGILLYDVQEQYGVESWTNYHY